MSDREMKKTEIRALPQTLTEAELRDRGHELASCVQDIAAELERQKSQKAGMKARIQELEGRKGKLANIVQRQEEDRDTVIEIWHNFDGLQVEYVRRDTGEIIDRRRMTNDELQQPLAHVPDIRPKK